MKYLARTGRYYLLWAGTFLFFNFYLIVLMPGGDPRYLGYLDFLMLVCFALFAAADYLYFASRERKKRPLLESGSVVFRELPDLADRDVMEHDARVFREEIRRQYEENCDLQDYIAKWCHEVKLPLSAALLTVGELEAPGLRERMEEQLERISRSLNSLLLGCRLQGKLFDLQIVRVSLEECVKTSVKNNRFFLIRGHFEVELDVGDCVVYSDRSWLVYVLDQLITNAIKYAGEDPKLRIYTRKPGGETRLYVRDNGAGIRKEDIRRIFEKGFTGGSCHDGKYKSTGMGLYLVSRILEKLEHEITVESVYGEYTEFCIVFRA